MKSRDEDEAVSPVAFCFMFFVVIFGQNATVTTKLATGLLQLAGSGLDG
jgi:hypothetical protein